MESLPEYQVIKVGGSAKPVPPHIQKKIDEAKAKAAEKGDATKLAEKLEKAEQARQE